MLPASRCAWAAMCTLLTLALAACTREAPLSDYDRWRAAAGHNEAALAYHRFLRQRGVDSVVPLPQLLRTGRRWQRCKADAYAVPPPTQWPHMVDTLRLVAELQRAGLVRQARVASAWRSAEFNRCEGGSARSQHLHNNALDFDVVGAADGVTRLCRYWREHGRARKFGLGFYATDKIHVDTAGFRTWGYDFHRNSSVCVRTRA